jgi:hypothetical protein
MKFERLIATAWIAFSLMGGHGYASTLSVVRGQVFVSHGTGYRPAYGVVDLKTGDSVFAKSDATAKIVFDDGCAVPLEVGTVFVLNEQSACPQGSGTAENAKPTPDPANDPARSDSDEIVGFEQAALPAGP